MEERENVIRLWFKMWLEQKDLGICGIFAHSALYIESYGPEYHGAGEIKRWFDDWNKTGKVLVWDIKYIWHSGTKSAVQWYFKNRNASGGTDEFDGVTVIDWTPENKIARLQEYDCNLNRYAPYKGDAPAQYRDEKPLWF